jgi:hypothetical protein
MAKFALAPRLESRSVEKESDAELRAEARQVLEQLEYSRAEAQRLVESIFARYKNLKSTGGVFVFEQQHSAAERV